MRIQRGRTLRLVFVLLVCFIFMMPFVYLVSTALKSEAQILSMPRAFFPRPLHFANFRAVFEHYRIDRYFTNTVLVVVGSVLGNVVVSTLAGYALSRMQFRGREGLFMATLACMFMPLFLLIVPRFLIFQRVRLIGTLWPLILPSAFGSP